MKRALKIQNVEYNSRELSTESRGDLTFISIKYA